METHIEPVGYRLKTFDDLFEQPTTRNDLYLGGGLGWACLGWAGAHRDPDNASTWIALANSCKRSVFASPGNECVRPDCNRQHLQALGARKSWQCFPAMLVIGLGWVGTPPKTWGT